MTKYTEQEKNKIGYDAFKIFTILEMYGYCRLAEKNNLAISLKLLAKVVSMDRKELSEARLQQELDLIIIDEELGS